MDAYGCRLVLGAGSQASGGASQGGSSCGCTGAAPKLPTYFTATSEDPKKPPAWPDPTGGNTGVWATPAGDGKGDIPEKLSLQDLYDRMAHNLISINFVWALVAGFLVMFMQAGFMFVETGLCRAKNASHTAAMNFLIYPLGCFAFWAYGFAIGWGNWWNGPVPPGWYASLGPGLSVLNSGWGLGAAVDAAGKATGAFTYGIIGTTGWFLNSAVNDVAVMVLFFFMMVFMDTTATIPTGAMAERWAWKNFVLYGLWVALPYCLYANWVWGGGWLAQGGINWGLGHGAVDFAGSGVVHGMGGIIGLAGAIAIGARIGKYDSQGRPRALPGHNVPMVVLGTFILGFWLVRIQPRIDPCGYGSTHQLCCSQHDACKHNGRDRLASDALNEGLEAGPDDDVQRHARGLGRHHGAVRVCQPNRRCNYWRRRRLSCRPQCFLLRGAQSR